MAGGGVAWRQCGGPGGVRTRRCSVGLVQEFKEFAVKGNAVDMAVGIIIGAAFNSVVQSIVNDIAMPPLGYIIGGVDFTDIKLTLAPERVTEAGKTLPEVAIYFGRFINTVINFLVVAFTVFIVIKFMNRLVRRRERVEEAA